MIKNVMVLLVLVLSLNVSAAPARYEVVISVLNEKSEIVSKPMFIVKEGVKGEMFTGPLDSGDAGHHFGVVANKLADGKVHLEFSSNELNVDKIELILKDQLEAEVELLGLLDKKLNKYRFKVTEL